MNLHIIVLVEKEEFDGGQKKFRLKKHLRRIICMASSGGFGTSLIFRCLTFMRARLATATVVTK